MDNGHIVTLPVPVPREAIAAFCKRNEVRKLSLFGSILGPEFRLDSDIDVLVEFDPEGGRGSSVWRGWSVSFRDYSGGGRSTCVRQRS